MAVDKKKKAVVKSKSASGKYTMKTASGGKADVGKKMVTSAKTKTGVFTPISSKTKSLTNKAGKYVGFKSQSGKVHKTTTGTVGDKIRLKKLEARDKALHNKQQQKRAAMAKRASSAKKK